MNTRYLIYSPTYGYWNSTQGWVAAVNDATQYSYEDTQLFTSGIMTEPCNDAEWIDFQF